MGKHAGIVNDFQSTPNSFFFSNIFCPFFFVQQKNTIMTISEWKKMKCQRRRREEKNKKRDCVMVKQFQNKCFYFYMKTD